VQLPHWSNAEQPSETWPQSFDRSTQLFGVQVPAPQTLGSAAPQDSPGTAQLPHESVPPQPSVIDPQFLPLLAQVVGTQTGLLGMQKPSWHESVPLHALHEPPRAPHALGSAPDWQVPAASQQPWQLAGPHTGAEGPHAAAVKMAAARRRERSRELGMACCLTPSAGPLCKALRMRSRR
jgi:hypothetical protein